MMPGTTVTTDPAAAPGTTAGMYQAVGRSIPAAAAALGVSANTVRAMIKRGELRAERVRRPQGYTLRVYLDDEVPAAPTSVTSTATSDEVPAASTYQAPTSELQRAEALAQYGATLLAPVLATVERLAAENRVQAETISQLRLELAQRPMLEPGQVGGGDAGPRASGRPRPWWRRWAWWQW
jgi:excisionase family DNA binding protein